MSDRIDRAIAKSILAAEGAAIGGAIGGPVGATIGAVGGLIIGDSTVVFPVDMIAIPAYQAYMLSGTPAMQIYIRAGETLMPTGGNVTDVTEAIADLPAAKPKRRKKNPWITFSKSFRFRAKRKNESSMEYFRLRNKACKTAYNKKKRGGK